MMPPLKDQLLLCVCFLLCVCYNCNVLGATWRKAELRCGNRTWADSVPKCYKEEGEEEEEYGDWAGVSLQEFMECPYNLAVNRQTR